MVATQDARSLIKSTFPGHDSRIDHAYKENELFRDLCQDYRSCAQALERWRRMNGDEPSSRAREYVELLAELTNEVQSWLCGPQDGTTPVRRGEVR